MTCGIFLSLYVVMFRDWVGRVVWGSLGQFRVVCIEEECKIYTYRKKIYIYGKVCL